MKKRIKRSTNNPICQSIDISIEEVLLQGETLQESLIENLAVMMSGTLDPDISNNKVEDYIRNLERNRLGDFSNRYIIISKETNNTGILLGIRKDNSLYITSLGIHPKYRCSKIGTQLLEYCRKQMKVEDIEFLELDVHSENIPAIKLYEKHNFL